MENVNQKFKVKSLENTSALELWCSVWRWYFSFNFFNLVLGILGSS